MQLKRDLVKLTAFCALLSGAEIDPSFLEIDSSRMITDFLISKTDISDPATMDSSLQKIRETIIWMM